MATVAKKEKGISKHSFRGYTPDQINELSQEKVVELFRARMRRRFSRSILLFIKKLSTSTSGFTQNAKRAKRTHSLEKSPYPSKPTSVMPLSSQKWWATTWQCTTARPSTTSKLNSTWLADIWVNSQSPTSQPSTVRPVWEQQKVQPILPLNDLPSRLNSYTIFTIKTSLNINSSMAQLFACLQLSIFLYEL